MNGFLVIARCGMNDVPLRLCASREEALGFARTVNKDDISAEAEDVYGLRGVQHASSVLIVEFRDGAPVGAEGVKSEVPNPFEGFPP